MLAAENKGSTGTRQTKRSHMYNYINFPFFVFSQCVWLLVTSLVVLYHVNDVLQRSTTFTKNRKTQS